MSLSITDNTTQDAQEVIAAFERFSGFTMPDWDIKSRYDGSYLVLSIAEPNERFFRCLNQALEQVDETNVFRERATIVARSNPPVDRLELPETKYLRTVISESLTTTQYSFGEDFLVRYIKSVFGAEDQIKSNANHVVYGRRGSGKSSLLAFLRHSLIANRRPFAWVSMQSYAGRADNGVIAGVLIEIIGQLAEQAENKSGLEAIRSQLLKIYYEEEAIVDILEIERLIPGIKASITPLVLDKGPVTVFLDDLHLIDESLQSLLLGKLYAIARDNQTYLKVSAIEQFSKIWDSKAKVGLQVPHDAQPIRLDISLTNPKKSMAHIGNILDALAKYCGLPNIKYISGDDVLTRLLWVAAGVPRDALEIYSQAIAKALVKDQRRVSVTSINEASSQNAQEKFREIEELDEERSLFERVRHFCVSEKHVNAFLVQIKSNDKDLDNIRNLIAHRLLHLIDEGFTPSEAGKRYMALMLDYGFYIGIRAAKSVNVFQKQPAQPQAKELRKLPIFPLA